MLVLTISEVILARKSRFRENRIYRCKITIVMVLFVIVLFSGLVAVDLNKSNVIYGEYRPELVKVELVDTDLYRVSVLNSKFTLNLKYIRRNINNLKTYFYSKI